MYQPNLKYFTDKPMNIVVEGHANSIAGNAVRHSKMVVPWADSSYSLSGRDYPFARFSSLVIAGDTVSIDGDSRVLKIGETLSFDREFSATDYSHVVWPEYVSLEIYAVEAE